MEGSMPNLPALLELKQKYKFYIYLDEAHSIGAIGKTGRGICEHQRIDHNQIDVLMGTFSKSFCAMGGYVAGSKELITYLRECSDGAVHAERLCPAICTQIIGALRYLKKDTSRIQRLMRNTLYMRKKLKKLKFKVLGDEYSPVVPILIQVPGKVGMFGELALSMGLAVVVVGYPATPVLTSRVRLCLSASHSRKDIDKALGIINHLGTILGIKGH